MGAGFSRGGNAARVETCGIESGETGEKADLKPPRVVAKLSVCADLLAFDEDLFFEAAENGLVSFELPADGKMLKLSVGTVSLFIDHRGRMLLDASAH